MKKTIKRFFKHIKLLFKRQKYSVNVDWGDGSTTVVKKRKRPSKLPKRDNVFTLIIFNSFDDKALADMVKNCPRYEGKFVEKIFDNIIHKMK